MANSDWLVVLIILKKYEFVNGKDYYIPYIMEKNKCLKPPTCWLQAGYNRVLFGTYKTASPSCKYNI